MDDAKLKNLLAIHNFMCPPDVEMEDGRRFQYNPSDEIVRKSWRGLSDAIRGIDITALTGEG